jgi:hypothetical protein
MQFKAIGACVIVFELLCSKRHRFEGWFASAEAFDRQSALGQVACPVCASADVRRVPSAKVTRPRAKQPPANAVPGTKAPPQPGGQAASVAAPADSAAAKSMALAAFIDHVLANSEDVGARFAEEARKIHYGEVAKRSIRGQASREETEELLDEGIPVVPLPIPPKDDWQ